MILKASLGGRNAYLPRDILVALETHAVHKPTSNVASQDALNGTFAERPEDCRVRAKPSQLS